MTTDHQHKLFIDASMFLAFLDRANPNHIRAVTILENIALNHNHQLYTSLSNITETASIATYDMGLVIAQDFLESMLMSDIETIFPIRSDLVTAHKIIKSNRDRQIVLKEALNATLMQRKDISYTLTFGQWNNLFGTRIFNIS